MKIKRMCERADANQPDSQDTLALLVWASAFGAAYAQGHLVRYCEAIADSAVNELEHALGAAPKAE